MLAGEEYGRLPSADRGLRRAVERQAEEERHFAKSIKRLTYLMTRILYTIDTVATQGSCTRGRESTHPFLVMETECESLLG